MPSTPGAGDSSQVRSVVKRSGMPWWAWTGIILFLLVVVGGIFSAIMIPGLVQARVSGNEASAIGYLHAVSSAEALAASLNKDYFLPPACLEAPSTCPPAISPTPLLAQRATDAYGTIFTVGAVPTADEISKAGVSPRSMKSWTLVAVPREPGVTGVRVFCADSNGGFYQMPDSKVLPETGRGKCGNAQPLQ